jgi:hypothetical protein
VLCSRGDSDRPTGSPITPTTTVAAESPAPAVGVVGVGGIRAVWPG